jgi:hypothetical protein
MQRERLWQTGITMACFYVESGVRKFDDFSDYMILALGEAVRPYLGSLYEMIRRWPGLEHIAAEMWSPEKVEGYLAPLSAARSAHDKTAPNSRNPNGVGGAQGQIRQLIKQALESPTAEGLEQFLTFATRFRRLAVWNARMAYIQRPGARVIAPEYEWSRAGRYVLPDAVPIIILWPFSPIRFVYELADTGPPVNREDFKDPFAVKGEFKKGTLSKLAANLKKQKKFKIEIEPRRQGFSYAGSAAGQGALPLAGADMLIGDFAHGNAKTSEIQRTAPSFRITINDRLNSQEQLVTLAHELGHIFCGHLGGCITSAREHDESGWPDRRYLGTHEREIEAEAVAYLVAARAGVETRSAEYLKRHAQRAEMEKINEDLIVRATARTERLAEIHYGTMLFNA